MGIKIHLHIIIVQKIPAQLELYSSLHMNDNSTVICWQGAVSEKNPLPWQRDARGDAQVLRTLLSDAETRTCTSKEEN